MRVIGYAVALVTFFLFSTTHAEEIRDYYSEPGLLPFKDLMTDLNETIDPFSGTLQLRNTDLSIPGNGGMDISVHRVYTNHQDWNSRLPSYQSVYGIGWTMHYGRIVVPRDAADRVCAQQTWSVSTADNPSIEHPDGGRELLVLATDGSGDLVTKSNWRASCVGNGIKAVSPDGTRYTMDVYSVVGIGDNANETSWYTSRIEDVHGNVIDISYVQNPLGYVYMDRISGGSVDSTGQFHSDGRNVQFSYRDVGGCLQLDSITANGQEVVYEYGAAVESTTSGYQTCGYNLTNVVLPSGLSWQYEYYASTHSGPGTFSVSKITYPYGGTVSYTYQHIKFDPEEVPETTAVKTKSLAGRAVTPGVWTYDFAPASRLAETGDGQQGYTDVTTITQPDGSTIVFEHQGADTLGLGNTWAAGLLLSKDIYAASGDLLERTVYKWAKRKISDENYFHGNPEHVDNETSVPVPTGTFVTRGGLEHATLMSNHDAFGNPGRIEETSVLAGQPSRVTNVTYYNNIEKWIIGLKKDETIEGIGSILRTFDGLGQITSENRFGVETLYTYTPQGDLLTVVDAEGNTTTTEDYYRGVAQLQTDALGNTTKRTVNDTGTIASITDARGNTRRFTYDNANRILSIDYPIHSTVNFTWGHGSKVAESQHLSGRDLARRSGPADSGYPARQCHHKHNPK